MGDDLSIFPNGGGLTSKSRHFKIGFVQAKCENRMVPWAIKKSKLHSFLPDKLLIIYGPLYFTSCLFQTHCARNNRSGIGCTGACQSFHYHMTETYSKE
jgi:hypothetical protein